MGLVEVRVSWPGHPRLSKKKKKKKKCRQVLNSQVHGGLLDILRSLNFDGSFLGNLTLDVH